LLGLMHQVGALLILSLLIISLCEAKKMGQNLAPYKT
jgi:ABC-type Mn2+/Zn2+ transport system permease subunit